MNQVLQVGIACFGGSNVFRRGEAMILVGI